MWGFEIADADGYVIAFFNLRQPAAQMIPEPGWGRMPFKSQAQRRKFAQLLVEGKISAATYEEWNRETGSRALPDHVKKKRAKRSTGRKRTTQRASVRKKR